MGRAAAPGGELDHPQARLCQRGAQRSGAGVGAGRAVCDRGLSVEPRLDELGDKQPHDEGDQPHCVELFCVYKSAQEGIEAPPPLTLSPPPNYVPVNSYNSRAALSGQ